MSRLKSLRRNSASLRWRLPISYAAIALLATLLLGFLLLAILRGFYRQQELSFLTDNARAIASEVGPLLGNNDEEALQTQAAGFSFLTQARVEILDNTQERVLADSGQRNVAGGRFNQATEIGGIVLDEISEDITIDAPGQAKIVVESAGSVEVETVIVEEQVFADETDDITRVITRSTNLSPRSTPLGFQLSPSGEEEAGQLSNLIVLFPVLDSEGLNGYVRLSQGPAYGASILRSVAWGWALASALAVVLAAVAGWLISRRLTRPLLDLTMVTAQMAAGDLSARAAVSGDGEVGALGQSFNEMAAQVESVVASLRHFVADAAHEIQTPLTALETDLQLLADHAGDDVERRRARRALAQARRLEDLGNGLLDLSRLESAGAGAPWESAVDVRQLLVGNADDWASRADQAGLHFDLSPGEVTVRVGGDVTLLQQAVENLVGNALKFTLPPGTVRVTLQTTEDVALIIVEDNGIGIPEADQPLLFGRFHRGQNTAEFPGSGLGLALAQAIAAKHGGRISLKSGNWGTVATLTLPLNQVDTSANE